MEERRAIAGYECLYVVSETGCVYRVMKDGSHREVKQLTDKDGYKSVCLCKENIKKSFRVHRLVAEAFIPNPFNMPVVNHKDEVKSNNHVSNLEWCSVKYNNHYNDGIKKRALKRMVPIVLFNASERLVFDSASVAASYLNTSHGNITSCARGYYGRKTVKGYKAMYLKDWKGEL